MPTATSLQLDCTINKWSIDLSTGDWATLADPTFTFTNASNSRALDAPGDGTIVTDPPGNPLTANQEWKIINVPNPDADPLYTPLYEIQNVGAGSVVALLCLTAGQT